MRENWRKNSLEKGQGPLDRFSKEEETKMCIRIYDRAHDPNSSEFICLLGNVMLDQIERKTWFNNGYVT